MGSTLVGQFRCVVAAHPIAQIARERIHAPVAGESLTSPLYCLLATVTMLIENPDFTAAVAEQTVRGQEKKSKPTT